ncbi:hypothetical protein KKC1_29460 [Calderihabitans maritimus]|uniref:Nitrogen regulatory protein P-II n=1 Tax=Calderihabitans maritimus TaxID=1246530 RepID=A0A1Z5HWA7_9FIRM|nr:hypothetical protein KKC1_29460 [Calderihabitans maritimus]
MKLVIAIVQDADADSLLEELIRYKFRATKLASSGGFLRRGNTTILIGVEDDEVEQVKHLIRANCERRQIRRLAFEEKEDLQELLTTGTVVLVLNVEEFEKF